MRSTIVVLLSIGCIQCVKILSNINSKKGDTMAKGQDKQKAVKKKSEKTLKEKRQEKKAKKS